MHSQLAPSCRSWRRIPAPLWMPEGESSSEVRLTIDESNDLVRRLSTDALADELESVISRFDWHSQVTIRFAEGDGGAGWNRSRRTITVSSDYLERFVRQGQTARLRN